MNCSAHHNVLGAADLETMSQRQSEEMKVTPAQVTEGLPFYMKQNESRIDIVSVTVSLR